MHPRTDTRSGTRHGACAECRPKQRPWRRTMNERPIRLTFAPQCTDLTPTNALKIQDVNTGISSILLNILYWFRITLWHSRQWVDGSRVSGSNWSLGMRHMQSSTRVSMMQKRKKINLTLMHKIRLVYYANHIIIFEHLLPVFAFNIWRRLQAIFAMPYKNRVKHCSSSSKPNKQSSLRRCSLQDKDHVCLADIK